MNKLSDRRLKNPRAVDLIIIQGMKLYAYGLDQNDKEVDIVPLNMTKQDIYENIAQEIVLTFGNNIDSSWVETRWKTLKDTMTRCKNSIENDPLYKPTPMHTFVLEHLYFLKRTNKRLSGNSITKNDLNTDNFFSIEVCNNTSEDCVSDGRTYPDAHKDMDLASLSENSKNKNLSTDNFFAIEGFNSTSKDCASDGLTYPDAHKVMNLASFSGNSKNKNLSTDNFFKIEVFNNTAKDCSSDAPVYPDSDEVMDLAVHKNTTELMLNLDQGQNRQHNVHKITNGINNKDVTFAVKPARQNISRAQLSSTLEDVCSTQYLRTNNYSNQSSKKLMNKDKSNVSALFATVVPQKTIQEEQAEEGYGQDQEPCLQAKLVAQEFRALPANKKLSCFLNLKAEFDKNLYKRN